ncbi:head maturation protease, ClpP-related [Enemella dayhoffiae]|nr:head maturation protease, ClpP-related [Enemella dayhoffiae]
MDFAKLLRPQARSPRSPMALAEGRASIYLYDVIGDPWFGVDTTALVKEIDALDVADIDVYINSPGGIAFDGIAIGNALRRNSAAVTVHVDGLCASAATIVALSGDEIIMARGAEFMIHDAWGLCVGPAEDMHAMAAQLDKLSDDMAAIYAEAAGGSAAEWRDVMRAETWYTADEAVAAGLATRVDREVDGAEAKAKYDLRAFAHAGRDNAPAPTFTRATTRAQEPPAEPAESATHQEGSDMSDTITSGLRERLGIKADVDIDEAGLMAALDEALAERAETTTPVPGTTVIDEATLADLQAKAAQGEAARAQQLSQEREANVNAAVADGRIPPARKDHWVAQLTADPGAADVLANLPKGTIPTAPAGFTGGVDQASDDDQLYSKAWGAPATKED